MRLEDHPRLKWDQGLYCKAMQFGSSEQLIIAGTDETGVVSGDFMRQPYEWNRHEDVWRAMRFDQSDEHIHHGSVWIDRDHPATVGVLLEQLYDILDSELAFERMFGGAYKVLDGPHIAKKLLETLEALPPLDPFDVLKAAPCR